MTKHLNNCLHLGTRSGSMATKRKSLRFTNEEESAILTCLANGVPLCCDEGNETIALIVDDDVKRDALAILAYEGLGCTFAIAENPSVWDRYFDKTVAWLLDCDDVRSRCGDPSPIGTARDPREIDLGGALLPNGWTAEWYVRPNLFALVSPGKGGVTIDLNLRCFRSGWTAHGNVMNAKTYAGRGWLKALVTDAASWLQGIHRK